MSLEIGCKPPTLLIIRTLMGYAFINEVKSLLNVSMFQVFKMPSFGGENNPSDNTFAKRARKTKTQTTSIKPRALAFLSQSLLVIDKL